MYDNLCEALNNSLRGFLKILNPDIFGEGLTIDKDKYFDLSNKGWWDINLGEVAFPGVYIIAYTNLTTNKPYLYIGKASLSSSIGRRLHAHLYNSQQERRFNWYGDNDYLALRVYTIDCTQFPYLAPAIEEFLIDKMQESYPLLNYLGNK